MALLRVASQQTDGFGRLACLKQRDSSTAWLYLGFFVLEYKPEVKGWEYWNCFSLLSACLWMPLPFLSARVCLHKSCAGSII